MNGYFFAAAMLAFGVGLVHSMLGERLVFRRMRTTGFVPVNGGQMLREPHVRILWASWHVATAMSWGTAAMLGWLALAPSRQVVPSLFGWSIAASMLASALLVLVGTRGKHPGWVGLLGVATLTVAGLQV